MSEENIKGIPLEEALEKIEKSVEQMEENGGITSTASLVDRIKNNIKYILPSAVTGAIIAALVVVGGIYWIKRYQSDLEARVSQPTPTAPQQVVKIIANQIYFAFIFMKQQ